MLDRQVCVIPGRTPGPPARHMALPTSIPGGILHCLWRLFRPFGSHRRTEGAARSGSEGGIRRGAGGREAALQTEGGNPRQTQG